MYINVVVCRAPKWHQRRVGDDTRSYTMSDSAGPGHGHGLGPDPAAGMDDSWWFPDDGELTPAAIAAAAAAELDATAMRRARPAARALAAWTASTPADTGSDSANVVDQMARRSYALAPDALSTLFDRLEACRLEGTPTHFSERQGRRGADFTSGIALDFDVVLGPARSAAAPPPSLDDRTGGRLAAAVITALAAGLDLAAWWRAAGGEGEPQTHVFFTVRAEASPLAADRSPALDAGGEPPAGARKWGFHLLVPGVWAGPAFKRWLVSKALPASPGIAAALRSLGALNAATALDAGSASFPALVLGAMKRAGARTPYALGPAFTVAFDPDGGMAPFAAPLPAAELAGRNLVAELALTAEASGAPLVSKRPAPVRAALAAEVADWGERAAGAGVEAANAVDAPLRELLARDPAARDLHAVLALLPPEYASERNRWRDVVFAIAGGGAALRPLAAWFTQRAPEKWARAGKPRETLFEDLWRFAIDRPAGGRALTPRSIHFWARAADPAGYAAAARGSHFTMLADSVFKFDGELPHDAVACVLHAMLGTRFVTDVEPGPRGDAHTWFEFVTAASPMSPGEVWKWRRESLPDSIHLYLMREFAEVLDEVFKHVEARASTADDDAAKYYKGVLSALKKTRRNIHCDAFKNGVERQARWVFRRRGFAAALDHESALFGVANGVLRIASLAEAGPLRSELLAGFHELPVSKFTPVAFRPFDENETWTRIALNAIADIIVEDDARDWILFHAATGLWSGAKEPLLLLWIGGGENAKTTFLRWVAKALGPYANKFPISLFTALREEPDRPNSAVVSFAQNNWGYAEESNKTEVLNPARLKELVNSGEASARELHSRQRTFTLHSNVVAASQYGFIVNTTDHGTHRRIRSYTSKAKFRAEADPGDPYVKKADARFNDEYSVSPQFLTAFLSILVHYWGRLLAEHDGKLKNVPCPTIERETAEFRYEQDTMFRWISQSIVIDAAEATAAGGVVSASAPATAAAVLPDVPVAEAAAAYITWYGVRIGFGKERPSPGDVAKEIAGGVLSKRVSTTGRELVIRACAVLAPGDEPPPGTAYIMPRHDATHRARPAYTPPRPRWWAARPVPPRAAGCAGCAGGCDACDGAADSAIDLNQEAESARDAQRTELASIRAESALARAPARPRFDPAAAAERALDDLLAPDDVEAMYGSDGPPRLL